MERLIALTYELQKLNNVEFKVFFDNLVTHYNERQFITKLLTHLMIHEIKNQNESTYCKTIHKYIQQIINNRVNAKYVTSSTSEDVAKPIKRSINSLPSTISSSVSTYLHFQEMISVQHTNKHLYSSIVSTSNSCSKMTLKSRMIQKYFDNFGDDCIHYKIHNFPYFRSITALCIDIPCFIKLSQKYPFKQSWIWKKITNPQINADQLSTETQKWFYLQTDAVTLFPSTLSNICINKNIEQL